MSNLHFISPITPDLTCFVLVYDSYMSVYLCIYPVRKQRKKVLSFLSFLLSLSACLFVCLVYICVCLPCVFVWVYS